MIISTGLTSSLAIAADKAIAEMGDDQTVVPSVISPVEKILAPHHLVNGGLGKIATTSFFTFFEKIRAASTGNTADVIVTLTRGLWTINWNMCANVQAVSVFGAGARIRFLVNMEGDTQNIGVIYGENDDDNFCSGQFRILLKDNADLRLDIGTTVASDAIVATVCLQGEKNIG